MAQLQQKTGREINVMEELTQDQYGLQENDDPPV